MVTIQSFFFNLSLLSVSKPPLRHHKRIGLMYFIYITSTHIQQYYSSVCVCELPVGVCCRCWVCLLTIPQCSCCSGRFSASVSCCLMPEIASLPPCWTSWVLLSWPTRPQCLLGTWVLPRTHCLISLYTPNPLFGDLLMERNHQRVTVNHKQGVS